MNMKKYLVYILIALFILAMAAFVFLQFRSTGSGKISSDSKSPVVTIPVIAISDLTQTYTDDTYHLSFKYPEGYAVTSFPDPQDGNANVIVIQNSSTTVGFQMRVAPIDEEISVLTVERIRQDLPDLIINNPQDVILGDGAAAGKGVAFTSDDPAFGGASREVWFIFNHNLYQIRTYAAYDPLIQAVLGSWMFE